MNYKIISDSASNLFELSGALCSFYAEEGGLLIGFED